MKMPLLQRLLLGNNLITDDGCKVLAKGMWRQLKSLELESNFIQDDGLAHLSKLGSYNLIKIGLFGIKTRVINADVKPPLLPTMKGLTSLMYGCWNRLKVEMTVLDKAGVIDNEVFIMIPAVKDMLEHSNVAITLNSK
jgi:hypothetical protein